MASGAEIVPVPNLAHTARSTEVVGTVAMVDGELVVQVQPTREYRDVTGRPVGPSPDVEVAQHPLARLGLRYVGPLTPEEAARVRAEVARWEALPRWRQWGTDFADWCCRWRR
jgi:hypothetical protein